MGFFTRWASRIAKAAKQPATAAEADNNRLIDLQNHIVDFKRDRSLVESDTCSVPAFANPNIFTQPSGAYTYPRTVMYGELPFFDALNAMQGTPDPLAVSSEEYSAARDRLFASITPDIMPIDSGTVFTQYSVNARQVYDIARNPLNQLRGKPVLAVQYGGSYYVLDGHHRIAAQLMLGRTELPARILRLKTEIQ